MAQRGLMAAVVSLLFLSTTVAGCISLIPAREMMESLRDPPRIKTTEDKVNISHTFDSLEISELTAPITGQRIITMNESVVQMQIYFRATMPTSGLTGDISNSIRYVDAKLLRPDGSVYWEQHVTESKSPVDNFAEGPFEPGEWRLEIEARGIGIDIGGVAVKDDFIVIVTVTRKCVEYPTEDECVIE
jgi:hypothetical protein